MKVDIEIAQNGVILRFPRKNADTPGAVMIVTSMDEMATVIRQELWSYDPVPPIVVDTGLPVYAVSVDMAAAADSDEDA